MISGLHIPPTGFSHYLLVAFFKENIMVNGCGGEGGFDFKKLKNKLKKLPLVKPEKLDSLYFTIELKCCYPHDDKFEKGGGIKEYLKANYEFAIELMSILHWTTFLGRLGILISVFFLLNIFGIRYFNWNFKKNGN